MSKAANWRGVDVALEERTRAREALLETWQWAQGDDKIQRIMPQVQRLAEYDVEYLDLMVQDLLWDYIGSQETSLDRERKWAVDMSRQAWRSQSPLAQWAIQTWTAWGLGDSVQVGAEDEDNGQPVIDEFLDSDRNAALLGQDNLHTLSERVLVDGNAFLSFFASTVDGKTTVRVVKQDEIGDPITDPDDNLTPWFYQRTSVAGDGPVELFYPDWALYCGDEDAPLTVDEAWQKLQDKRKVPATAVRADQVRNGHELGGMQTEAGTAVCMLHISHNRKDFDSLWGWPMLTVALPWLRTHKRFAQARLTVAMSVAQFVRRSRVKGGSRAVQSVIDTIASNLSQSRYTDTNPPAAPGSWAVENEAVTTSELPMRTGAQDAEADNKLFAWMVAAGCGLTTISIGLDASRWATAIQMDKVQSSLMTRYQSFWSTQFQRMARIVLTFAERYGNVNLTSKSARVSMDTFGLPDFPGIVESESRMMAELTASVTAGVIPANAAAAIQARMAEAALQALGVQDASELTNDEAFHIGDFEDEEEEPKGSELPPVQMVPMMQQPAMEQPETEEPEGEPPMMPTEALMRVRANYADGSIDLETLAENVLAEWVERTR